MYLMNSAGGYAAIYEYGPYGEVISASGTMAQTNPLRYRGYYYDTETGFYYLQSRYYDPAICRFINADSLMSTGQNILGFNMFAYCNNNPVLYFDECGDYPLEFALELLMLWLNGNGSYQLYTEESRIVKLLKKSSKMQKYINQAIKDYESGNGEYSFHGTGEFSPEDGYELFLSTQHFDYTVLVCKETRTVGFWIFRHEQTRYETIVSIHDTYNFDKLRKWDGFGNIMNNLAYIYHAMGGGTDFEWNAVYISHTEWKDSD